MSVPDRDDEPEDGRPGELTGPGPDAQPDEASAQDARDREEEAWLAIVAAYGERPDWEDTSGADVVPLDDGHDLDDSSPAPVAPPRGPHPDHPAGRGRELRGEDEPDLAKGPEERFVPPAPPPLPWVAPQRLVAWFGVFGVPAVVLVTLLLGVQVASWVGVLLMLWFVGGFCYLVASMRPGRDDDPDDGAVV